MEDPCTRWSSQTGRHTSLKSRMRNPLSKASAHASNHRACQGLSRRAVRDMHHVFEPHLLHSGVHRGQHDPDRFLVKHVSFKCWSIHSCASLPCFPPCWHLYTRGTTVHEKMNSACHANHGACPGTHLRWCMRTHTLVGTPQPENPSAALSRTPSFHRRRDSPQVAGHASHEHPLLLPRLGSSEIHATRSVQNSLKSFGQTCMVSEATRTGVNQTAITRTRHDESLYIAYWKIQQTPTQ